MDVDAGRLRGDGSSRAARSWRPSAAPLVREGDARRPRATPTVACHRSVVSGTVESVSGPGPIFSQFRTMFWVIPSTANVAMPAASPERRISGMPTSKA